MSKKLRARNLVDNIIEQVFGTNIMMYMNYMYCNRFYETKWISLLQITNNNTLTQMVNTLHTIQSTAAVEPALFTTLNTRTRRQYGEPVLSRTVMHESPRLYCAPSGGTLCYFSSAQNHRIISLSFILKIPRNLEEKAIILSDLVQTDHEEIFEYYDFICPIKSD
ncbi:uncharacterized protein BX663DRAFT_488285 [Cokeromyces recurvatus]|uniref:uncharacterized protein n=1 Tax=Cokeromyces recurvatus TaxID=90255 RepID=UPI00221E582E|nr:uncharacterized protein BX663DRAFT_488285 [Cokeromyces recurvatus]KAI7900672.1 hypothetical protein BX663DRAFT_488285 [Cokeromyces recurvatus]